MRAQRRAREERRRAAKEAMDARRRWIDPWGAAQQEAREQETLRRREAFMEKIDREREAFRSQRPWGGPYGPWNDHSPGVGPAAAPPSPEAPEEGAPAPGDPSRALYPPLPGWDNRWYYRGF
ncbi:MAG: hypothetical protein U9Q81_25935 [Pseudomonadota bacterium]|nr:hypothetical protein [Pseudomonadota bacterium]